MQTVGGPVGVATDSGLRHRAAAFLAITLVLLAASALLAGSAQAARIHPLLLMEALPESGRFTSQGNSLAANQTTHHFYVVGENANTRSRRVYNYESNGQLDPTRPELTGAPALEPWAIAVDNSGGPQNGYIYVSDFRTPGVVQQFNAQGEATAVEISEASIPPDGTPQGGGLPPVVNPGGFEPRSLAVDSAGNIYVGDRYVDASPWRDVIDKFTAAGEFVAQFAPAKKVTPDALAISAGGDIYVASHGRPEEPYVSGLVELNASGECVAPDCTPIDPAPVQGVAVDSSRGTIYSVGRRELEEGLLREYDATTHELLGVTSGSQLHEPLAVAVQEAADEVLVADRKSTITESTIQIYGPVEVVPDVTTLAAEEVSDHGVTLRGEIGAAEIPGATCAFQFATAEEFAADRFEDADEAPCEPAGPFSGTAMNPVAAHINDLRGGTIYKYRLVGANNNGINAAETLEFMTHGPTITGVQANDIGQTGATLEGAVNPQGSATTYRFQYVAQASFDATGFAGAIEVPSGGGSVGEGTVSVAVSQRVEGLVPGTAYRVRIVAVSGDGETRSESISFSTFFLPTAGLPDGRRYEQASPTDKNGSNAQGGINSVQTSPGGSGITFFSQTGIPGGEGAQSFPYYLSRRADDGSSWSTQGILPPASHGPQAAVLGWTEDLSDTYDFARKPSEAGELLRRSNLGAGGLARVATTTEGASYAFAGSSTGGGVAVLESPAGGLLSGDQAGKQNVYAYDRETGTLAVAGVLNPTAPGGKPIAPPGGAMAGPFGWFENTGTGTGIGGALGAYFTQDQRAISNEGTKVYFTAGETGQLYVRDNPLAPQSAMSGEQCTEITRACTIRISAPEEGVADPVTPAAFVGASADGSVAYFLDRGKLTADATGGAGYDLYRYDLRDGALTDMTLDSTDKRGARVEGVLGISTDGNAVYFVAAGQLTEEASQAPAGETNLYALEGDRIQLVARLGTGGALEMLGWIPRSIDAGGSAVAHASRVSADGHTLLFRSIRQLTAYRNHGVAELYLYQLGGDISCISCNPSGQAPAGPAGIQEIPKVAVHNSPNHSFMTRNLSADGRRVIFDSADRLLSADENNVNDVYEWEAAGKGSCTSEADAGGCLLLISAGAKNAGPSWFGDADQEGHNVFFFTAQSLVAQDKDELIDVYDARVGGGIPGQEALPSIPCHEEADCLPHAEGEPGSVTPQSPGTNGKNVVPMHHCKRGFVRRHGKCARRHKRHHRRHGRHHHRHHGKGKEHQAKGKKSRHGRAKTGGGR